MLHALHGQTEPCDYERSLNILKRCEKMTLLRIIDERATEGFVPEYLLRPVNATDGAVWVPVSKINPDDLEPVSRAALWQAISLDTFGEVRPQKQLEDALGDGRIIWERCGATLAPILALLKSASLVLGS
jgi:hypothetical protein